MENKNRFGWRERAVIMLLLAFAALLLARLFALGRHSETLSAAASTGSYTLKADLGDGVIYDSSFRRLTGQKSEYLAIVHPTPEAVRALIGHTIEVAKVRDAQMTGKPFLCKVDSPDLKCADITVFEVPVRYSDTAVHLIGYTNGDGIGMSGLEAAYNDFLRGASRESKVVYTVNAQGDLLGGIEKKVEAQLPVTAGVVTTLDRTVQEICESAIDFPRGAVVVLDVKSGELLSLVSVPAYDPERVADSLSDVDAPFLNRALCAYGVGSVFKTVTAAAALESGLTPGFSHCCTGAVTVYDQRFRCHNLAGHQWLDMTGALTESCNTYCVMLSRMVSAEGMYYTAHRLGFGTEIVLADGIRSSGGNLPAIGTLEIPAERANFAFGQGKLTATPLQVAGMTAAVAADGWMPQISLVRGITEDGVTLSEAMPVSESRQVLAEEVAIQLRGMLTATVDGNEDSNARARNTKAAGKTSTAQTGRYDKQTGEELCHAWMTGFFPADAPKYAVTVFVEDGGSGNEAAAPVFRRIVEEMTAAGY